MVRVEKPCSMRGMRLEITPRRLGAGEPARVRRPVIERGESAADEATTEAEEEASVPARASVVATEMSPTWWLL